MVSKSYQGVGHALFLSALLSVSCIACSIYVGIFKEFKMCLLSPARSRRDCETPPCSHAIGVSFYATHPESLMKVKYVDIFLFRRMHDIDFSGAQSITAVTPTSHNLQGGPSLSQRPQGGSAEGRGGRWKIMAFLRVCSQVGLTGVMLGLGYYWRRCIFCHRHIIFT